MTNCTAHGSTPSICVPLQSVVESTPSIGLPLQSVVESTPSISVPLKSVVEGTPSISVPLKSVVESTPSIGLPLQSVVEGTPTCQPDGFLASGQSGVTTPFRVCGPDYQQRDLPQKQPANRVHSFSSASTHAKLRS